MPRALRSAVVAATLAIAVGDVRAATFVVNTTADAPEGDCGAAPGECTFRDAVAAASKTPGRDTIAFDPTVFPHGSGGSIVLDGTLRVIADPAGTVIDGAGASVGIQPLLTGIAAPDGSRAAGPVGVDGIVFASADGAPLADVTVKNVTISAFTGRGLVVCGGLPPDCEEDVSGTVVENVVLYGNHDAGLHIRGRNVAKTRIVATVAVNTVGDGMRVEASGDLVGTRIERATARGSVVDGFDLDVGGDAEGTVVADVVTVSNGGLGLRLLANGTVTKTKVTGSAAASNTLSGFLISGDQLIGATLANVTASTNGGLGIVLSAGKLLSTAVVKDTVANWNLGGLSLNAVTLVTGAKLTNVKAAGNQNGGIVIDADHDVAGSKVSRVVVAGNGFDGLRVRGSRNVISRVRADGNHADGIHLIANDGSPGVGNTITKSATVANDGAGIVLDVGVTQSTVKKNSAFAADNFDLRDENPACDGNVWKQNAFGTRSQPCIE